MTRLYSSISVETILSASITSSQTSLSVATSTGSSLLGGVTLAAGNVDQFTIAIDPDTVNEEIVFITANSGDTFTIVRGRAGSTAITHASGATVRHVLTSDDLNFFKTAIQPSTLTAKGDTYVATASGVVTNIAVGADGTVLTADSAQTKGIKWATPATFSLPSQTGNAGKFLTTDGTNASWGTAVTTLNLSFNAQTGTTYTVATTDVNKLVTLSNASAITLTVPYVFGGVFATGNQINIQQIGAGQVTFAAASGATITSSGATVAAPKLRTRYSGATLICTGANTYTVIGDIA
jgi:hypothetical protein